MSTGWYSKTVDSEFMQSLISMPHSACLIKSNYLPDLDAHEFVSDIPSSSIVATAPIENPVVGGGVFKADNTMFVGVAAQNMAVDKVIIKNDITGRLVLAFCDVSGLNVMPNGNDMELCWNSCGIAAL